jgi:hypothetical protein
LLFGFADFIPEMEETGVKQIQDINMQVETRGSGM